MTAGDWAGTVIHTRMGQVCVKVTQERWDKTRKMVRDIWQEYSDRQTELPVEVLGEDSAGDLNHKQLERRQGFLVYVDQAYPSLVPYLKGIYITLDSWRSDRNEDGWKQTRVDMEHLRRNGYPEETMKAFSDEAPRLVMHVPRLEQDWNALLALTDPLFPPEPVRSKHLLQVCYGFGDASGEVFGSIILLDGTIEWESGSWKEFYKTESSNRREFENLVQRLESFAKSHRGVAIEVFMFTDNYVAECVYFRGTSSSPILFGLVLRLRKLELHAGWKIHVIHIAGTRMISQGRDGLSQGDMLTGVMGGADILTFIPLALTAVERQPDMMEWVDSWWGTVNNSRLTPEGWYAGSGRIGTYVWCPPPAASDAALEQLCKCHLKRPGGVASLFIVPRMLTSRWRKRGFRVGTFSFTIPSATAMWKKGQHEPLICIACLPLSCHRPWSLWCTKLVGEMERSLRGMQSFNTSRTASPLRKFLEQARALESMRIGMVRHLLRSHEVGQVSCEDLGD
jgi:hypothetical protein